MTTYLDDVLFGFSFPKDLDLRATDETNIYVIDGVRVRVFEHVIGMRAVRVASKRLAGSGLTLHVFNGNGCHGCYKRTDALVYAPL